MTRPIWKNPFFLCTWWVWRRQRQRAMWQRTRMGFFLIHGLFVGVLIAYSAFASSDWPRLVFHQGLTGLWLMFFLVWLAVLSAVSAVTTTTYQRERDLGTLPIVSLTAIRPHSEVWGRWLGGILVLAELWLISLPHFLLSPFCTRTTWTAAICLWLFCGLWCAVLAAIGLACSAATGSSNGAVGALAGCMIAGFLVYPVLLDRIPYLAQMLSFVPHVYSAWLLLPPLITGFTAFFTDYPVAEFLLVAPIWVLFLGMVLYAAGTLVAGNFPLRAYSPKPLGATGIIPRASPHDAGRQTVPPKPLGIVGLLLRSCERNPYYLAYRKGFMRLHEGQSAAPGSSLPPALAICSLLLYGSNHPAHVQDALNPDPICYVLLGGLAAAWLTSLLEGIMLGQRALLAERDQATWPLLLVTGISPRRVLQGKFAAAFYALSGEWTVTLAFWLLAAVISGNPALLLLAPVHPACIAVGIVSGLMIASQTRTNLAAERSIPLVIFRMMVVAVVALALSHFPSLCMDLAQNPVDIALVRDVIWYVVQIGVVYWFTWMVWRTAVRCLNLTMRGV